MRVDNPIFTPGGLNAIISSSVAGRVFEGPLNITTQNNAPPTKGTTTVDKMIVTDLGNGFCLVTMNYFQSTAGTSGNGEYQFILPSAADPNPAVFDLTYHSAYTTPGNPGMNGTEAWIPGSSGILTFTGGIGLKTSAYAMVYSPSAFRILMGAEMLFDNNTSIRNPVGSTFFSMGTAGIGFQMSFIFKKA